MRKKNVDKNSNFQCFYFFQGTCCDECDEREKDNDSATIAIGKQTIFCKNFSFTKRKRNKARILGRKKDEQRRKCEVCFFLQFEYRTKSVKFSWSNIGR